MSLSYRIIPVVCWMLFSFSLVWAKGKIAQSYTIQMDVDSVHSPRQKKQYGFRFYTQLPVTKAFQTRNSFSSKSKGAHRKRKGIVALPTL
ncbi:hypothetical protein [Flavobacterium sp.]|uniref:hypothetical protein n=1 Tax=Flavobacterium sp. TaxID=239 RepID=UPI002634981D|nr:hypothetical protein [Flavobacterium sp.]